MKNYSKLKSRKKKIVNLKRTKRKVLDGGNDYTSNNWLYLTRNVKKLSFTLSEDSIKMNRDYEKHSNIETFRHQSSFMKELLKTYTKKQTYVKEEGNIFRNEKKKLEYHAGAPRFKVSENTSDKTGLSEFLYVERDNKDNIYFKIVFKKGGVESREIAPFVVFLSPKNNHLNMYVYTFLRYRSNVREQARSQARNEETLSTQGKTFIPKDFKDKVQVDLIKKISWEDFKQSVNHGDDYCKHLIDNSGWLGNDASRSKIMANETGSDTQVKKILKEMSESWSNGQYLHLPTANQDPYNIKISGGNELKHSDLYYNQNINLGSIKPTPTSRPKQNKNDTFSNFWYFFNSKENAQVKDVKDLVDHIRTDGPALPKDAKDILIRLLNDSRSGWSHSPEHQKVLSFLDSFFGVSFI